MKVTLKIYCRRELAFSWVWNFCLVRRKCLAKVNVLNPPEGYHANLITMVNFMAHFFKSQLKLPKDFLHATEIEFVKKELENKVLSNSHLFCLTGQKQDYLCRADQGACLGAPFWLVFALQFMQISDLHFEDLPICIFSQCQA